MAQRIGAPATRVGMHKPVALVPALYDAQEALQEVETKRRKEDLAIDEGVNEVLA
jgi:hypothetical protein